MWKLFHRLGSLWNHKPGQSRAAFRPTLEGLESRWVPAGNVSSTLFPNFLILEGDALDNNVLIRSGEEIGEVVVRGKGGTTIDGAPKQTFTGIGRISLLLGEGDDVARASRLSLTNLTTVGSLVTLAGLSVDAGPGDDFVRLSDISVVARGEGFDVFDTNAFLQVRGDSNGGPGGNDIIRVVRASVEATGASRAIAQIDVFPDFNTTSPGHDEVSVRDTTVHAEGATVANRAFLAIQELGGGGNDTVTVARTLLTASGPETMSRMTIDTGDGEDAVTVRRSTFDRLTARLGSGNDRMVFQNNRIGTLATLDGQDDDDSLTSRNNSGTIQVLGFEN